MRSFADRIVFNEAAKSAEALFKECILEWGQGADPKLVSLVNYAFETDKQGNLSFSKIYSLYIIILMMKNGYGQNRPL